MATQKKVTRSRGSKKPAAPAAVLREQKAKIAEAMKVAPPHLPGMRHPASDAAEAIGRATKTIGALTVPMTLAEVCDLVGTDVSPEDFASTALESIGDQIYTLATLTENDASNESWRLFRNLSERAKLAGRVTAWLEAEPTELPEVKP